MQKYITVILALVLRVVFFLVAGKLIVFTMFPQAFEAEYDATMMTILAALLVALCRKRVLADDDTRPDRVMRVIASVPKDEIIVLEAERHATIDAIKAMSMLVKQQADTFGANVLIIGHPLRAARAWVTTDRDEEET